MQSSVFRIAFWVAVAGLVFGSAGHLPRCRAQRLDEPRVASTNVPAYPPLARAACVQGRVAVVVTLDQDGKVTNVETLFGHPLLRQLSEAAARLWTFEPVRDGGVQRRQVIKFVFRILPFETPPKKVRAVFLTPTDVEVRAYPFEPICDDCSPRRQKELRKGGCPESR